MIRILPLQKPTAQKIYCTQPGVAVLRERGPNAGPAQGSYRRKLDAIIEDKVTVIKNNI
jgi:hypothetical protein